IAGGAYAEAVGATLPLNTWTHLAATYDGATMRLYVNGALAATKAGSGSLLTSTNQLQIGGDSIYGQDLKGAIDEVRVYNTALSQAQVQSDMNTPLGGDAQPPTAPVGLTAAGGAGQVALSWAASTDNVGVTGYLIERQSPGSSAFVQIA